MKVEIDTIKEIAKAAGNMAMQFYQSDIKVAYKDNDAGSPVTAADLASEKVIKERLSAYALPILSEESEDDRSRLDSEYVWIVDPLDGTSDFIERTGEFSIMIGLVRQGEPILGVVYEPVSGRCYWAEKGNGAFVENNGTISTLAVFPIDDFGRMTILLSRNHLLETEVRARESLGIGNELKVGSAGIKICRIAQGKGDVYINSSNKTSEWDTCAAEIILREAGGTISDLDGNELRYNKEVPKNLRGFLASTGVRQQEILLAIKG
jgi:3'(2'), 5'-bisphosphate nucleotidase